MKVKATYRHVFNVTREVEIDPEEFEEWASKRYGDGYDAELAIAVWLDEMDTEFHASTFADWRTDKPLPSDFELQYSEVEDVVISTPVSSEEANP